MEVPEKFPLTTEEEAQFNILNAAAMDLYRKALASSGINGACWLCMSEEAREKCRKALYAHLIPSGIVVNNPQEFNKTFPAKGPLLDLVARWKAAETAYKQLREQGNPRAFFVGG